MRAARVAFAEAWRLWGEGRVAEALAAYEEVVRRFGARREPELAELVGKALVDKGVALVHLGRAGEVLELVRALPAEAPAPALVVLAGLLAAALIPAVPGDRDARKALGAVARRFPEALPAGLLSWLRQRLPLSPEQANGLVPVLDRLRQDFGSVPDVARVLEIVDAVRRDALGERGASLEIPLELRQLLLPDA